MYRASLQKFIQDNEFKRLTTTPTDRLHGLHLYVESDIDSAHALRFLNYSLVRFLGGVGGALPWIVFDELRGDDSNHRLEEAGSRPLADADLDRCLGVLKGVAIYITAELPGSSESSSESSLSPPPPEGTVMWTLTEDQFAVGGTSDRPDVSKAAAVIYISGFRDAVKDLSTEVRREGQVKRIVGRARLIGHEGTHARRMHHSILAQIGQLRFVRNACGDWCLWMDEFRDKIATPANSAKLAGYVVGQKLNQPDFPADAGRVLEHSITGGKAIFELDLNVVVVLRRTASTAAQHEEEIRSKCLAFNDTMAVFRDPFALRAISRIM